MENVDKNSLRSRPKIGLFDSGIGGFSVLSELFEIFPAGDFYYYSDDANAPYGPKSDEFITERSLAITKELLNRGVELIVVACNTATASSIDCLRKNYPDIPFVGVEPYLNAYYKIPDKGKMLVLTTESTGKSERFKRLKERLDPEGHIDHFPLRDLAKNVETLYADHSFEAEFDQKLAAELAPMKNHGYTHAILGCTHYPLVRKKIENILNLIAVSPCRHVAMRVLELSKEKIHPESGVDSAFSFYSSSNNQWISKKRHEFLGPFKK